MVRAAAPSTRAYVVPQGAASLHSTGQREAERRGAAFRQHLDATLVGTNDLLDDVEAEPEPIAPRPCCFRWMKRVEKVGENRRVDFAAVADAEEDAVRPRSVDSHADGLSTDTVLQ